MSNFQDWLDLRVDSFTREANELRTKVETLGSMSHRTRDELRFAAQRLRWAAAYLERLVAELEEKQHDHAA